MYIIYFPRIKCNVIFCSSLIYHISQKRHQIAQKLEKKHAIESHVCFLAHLLRKWIATNVSLLMLTVSCYTTSPYIKQNLFIS